MSKASYIGKEPTYGVFISQAETGDGSTVAFSLDATAATTASVLVSVGGVIQQPGSAFNLNAAGTTLTFTAAPASSVPIWLLFLGQTLTVPTAAAASSTLITGESALGTAPSAADTFLLYDNSAAALKKVTYANLIPAASGDVTGPGSSTDDALAKFDSTTGKIIQNSTATLTDAGVLTSTTFVGNLTGNASGTAATVTGATQSAITALGTIASLVATTADINGGTFDGIVGGTTPADGSFTTLSSSGVATLASMDGILGSATPAAVTATQVDITAQGDLRLQDTTGGQYVGFQAAGTTTTYTITMPAAAPTVSGQVLTATTAGVASWAAGGETWAIKTSAYTAVAGDGVMVDTDSSAITITLPISSGPPTLGDVVRIMDATGNCATNNITVARNGNTIQGAAADLTIATNRASIGLVYVNATEGWVLIEN